MLSTSRKPLVVTKPVVAPLPVSTALVVIVVPCTIVSTWPSSAPSSRSRSSAARSSPEKKPIVGSSGVVGAL